VRSRVHVYVTGKVQGVFFRAETVEVANSLGVGGWVRNLPDGRVEALFEGDKEKVEQAVDFCKRGPPGAHVQNVEIRWEDWEGECFDFKIRF
jgi:acylphosphatase